MVTYTTTYNLKKPTVADDEDVWGGYLNDSMDLIDDVLDGTTPVTGIDINSGTLDNVTINSSAIGGTTAAAGTFTTLSATTSLGVTGNITVSGTVDGRDVAADGTKLDGIESGATADQTKADIDALGIAASTAATLATARNIALSGDVSGSASFNGSANISITATVADDSHNHVISNVDGLQTALDGKLGTTAKAADSNLLDGIDSSAFLRSNADDTFTGNIETTSTNGIRLGSANQTDGNDGFIAAGKFSSGLNIVGTQTTAGTGRQVRVWGSLITDSGNSYWHSGNDGSGSGLDADTVDGIQASSFVRSDTSDTMSGTYSITGNLGVGNTTPGNSFANGKALALGDNDTGIRQDGDGELELWANNQEILHINTSQVSSVRTLNMNGQNLTNVENIYLRNKLFHDGDTDTYVGFGTNAIDLFVGGTAEVQINSNGMFLDAALKEDYDALSGTTPTCNVTAGGAFSLTMTGNTTFTFSGASSGWSNGFVLQLTGNGGTVTWPASVDWAGGTAPDAPASGETDIYVFWTRDGGTTWYGVQSIDAAA